MTTKKGLVTELLDKNYVFDSGTGLGMDEWSFLTFVTFQAKLQKAEDWYYSVDG
jgi:hypothetical protein